MTARKPLAERFRRYAIDDPEGVLIARPLYDEVAAALEARPPLALADYTEGVEQWTYTAPGVGDVELEIVDFDHERDDDEAADMVDTLERWRDLIDERTGDGLAWVGSELEYWRGRVADLEREQRRAALARSSALADV